ncbi:MAG: site-specific integrase [Magnetospirillum sp.]|nr:site-specific integrase [Magnetospirillum sp.]
MPKPNRGPHLHWRDDRNQWVIRWFEHGKQRQKGTGFGRGQEAEAEKALARFILDTEKPGPRDPAQRKIADVLAAYADEHGESTSCAWQIGYQIERLVEYWGDLNVADITEAACRAYGEWRKAHKGTKHERDASTGTWGNDLITLGAAINHDFRKGRLTRTVFVWKPQRPDARDRWLTRKELAKLLRAARKIDRSRWHLTLFILMGYYLAARKEAILSLRWPQVDLERGRVDLNPPGRPRTSKGRPLLPIPNRLLTFLKLARKKGTDTGFVLHYHGGPIKDIRKSFTKAVKLAGLEGKVTPHVLRHTSATHMAEAGVDMRVISLYLGHTSTKITERVYAKHSPDYLSAATRFFDRR